MSIFFRNDDPDETCDYRYHEQEQTIQRLRSDLKRMYYALKAISQYDDGDADDYYSNPQDHAQSTLNTLSVETVKSIES